MRAVRIHAFGGPEVLSLDEIPTPRPGAGQALVRVAAAGVNYIDVYAREGQPANPLPWTLGLEAAGTVTELGAGATGYRLGEVVAFVGVPGAYAEYAAVPCDRLVRLPDGYDPRLAAAVLLQGMTAHYLTRSVFPLAGGHCCLVHAAAGGIGSLLVQLAHRSGARVLATVSSAEKAEVARANGADEVLLYGQGEWEAEVRRLTGGAGVDVVFDSVGRATFEAGLSCLKPRGMMVVFGASSGQPPAVAPETLKARGSLFLTRPSLFHYIADRASLEERAGDVLSWAAAGRLTARVSAALDLAEAAAAHRRLEGRATTGKLLLLP